MSLTSQVVSIDALNQDTRRVVLQLPQDSDLFKAGQYLELLLPHKNCPFSIASAPQQSRQLELHIRPTPNSGDSEEIEAWLDSTPETVDIAYPKGDAYLEQQPDGPLVLIAASTGVTQMKSIVEHLLAAGLSRPVHLYWGVVSDSDLYLSDYFLNLAEREPQFHYTPVVSEPATSPDWTGKTGLVGEVALADFADLSDATVFVGGGPAMVYACLDAFVERGMPEANMSSDIFSYAPRPKA